MADLDQLSSLFLATFSSEPGVRQRAESQLQLTGQQDGMASVVLQLVASETLDGNVRQAAAIYLKNRIAKEWDIKEPSDKRMAFPTSDRVALKQNILPVLLRAPPRIQVLIKAAFDTMVRLDFPDEWPGLVEGVNSEIAQPNNHNIAGALIALGVLLNVSRYKGAADRDVPNRIVAMTFPHLVRLGSSLLAQTPLDQTPEHIGLLLHLMFKCYRFSIQRELSEHQRSQESIVAWGTLFLQVVNRQLPPPSDTQDEDDLERMEWWKAKKWAYSLLNILFARYGCASQLSKVQQADYAAFAKTFEASFAPEILKAYLRQVELNIAGQIWLSQRCRRHIIDFLTECIKPKSMWLQLKPHVPAIIENFLFPIYVLSDEEVQQFTEEPTDFVRDHMNDIIADYFRLPITAAEQFIDELVKKRKPALNTVLQFISGVVQRYPAECSPKQKDAALRLLAGIASAVVDSKAFGKHLEGFVTQYVTPEFASQHGYLRARACSVVTALESRDMHWESADQLNAMLQTCLSLLTDRELPVRVAAALALPELSRYEQVRTILAPNIGPVMQQLLASANDVDIDPLSTATKMLFETFTEELTPFAVDLSAQLTKSYMRLVTEAVAAAKEDDSNEFDENKTLAAMGNLRSIEQLLESVEDLPDQLALIEAQVLPAVTFTLQNEVCVLYDEVFEILDSFLFYQKKVSPAMWQVFELLYNCFKGDGLDYVDSMLPVWDNFLSYGAQHIIAHPPYIQALLAVIETIMTSDRLGAEDRCTACKIGELMFLNLRGAIDAYMPALLQHALSFIFRADDKMDEEPVVTNNLYLLSLELVVNAIYYNPKLAFEYLAQHNAVKAVLQKWLADVSRFTRVHDRKLCIAAIVAILQDPQSLPVEVLQAAPTLIVAAVTLFGGLPSAIANRQRAEENAINSDDDSDGDAEPEEDDEADAVADVDGDGDEDLAGDEIDEDVILSLLKSKLKNSAGGADALIDALEESDADEDEEWEEEILFTSPLDDIDVYVLFARLVINLQRDTPAAFGGLGLNQQQTIQEVIRIAEAGGEQTLRKKTPVENGHAPIPVS